jgi:hypothetical protein
MTSLLALWLPIIVSAVAIFFASFLTWMVLPHHKGDWKGAPDEDELLEKLRSIKISPGQYSFPFCRDPKEAAEPEMKRKFEKGPNGVLVIWPSRPSLPSCLIWVFIFYLVVSIFVAYISGLHLETGAGFLPVFQTAGVAGVMAYAMGFIPNAIFFRKPTGVLVKDIIDAVAYGLITGALFGILWPSAAAAGA